MDISLENKIYDLETTLNNERIINDCLRKDISSLQEHIKWLEEKCSWLEKKNIVNIPTHPMETIFYNKSLPPEVNDIINHYRSLEVHYYEESEKYKQQCKELNKQISRLEGKTVELKSENGRLDRYAKDTEFVKAEVRKLKKKLGDIKELASWAE